MLGWQHRRLLDVQACVESVLRSKLCSLAEFSQKGSVLLLHCRLLQQCQFLLPCINYHHSLQAGVVSCAASTALLAVRVFHHELAWRSWHASIWRSVWLRTAHGVSTSRHATAHGHASNGNATADGHGCTEGYATAHSHGWDATAYSCGWNATAHEWCTPWPACGATSWLAVEPAGLIHPGSCQALCRVGLACMAMPAAAHSHMSLCVVNAGSAASPCQGVRRQAS